MVEENFKLNLNIELDQSGLADLQKQIERAVQKAFSKATRGLKSPGGGRGPAGPTAATARSAREAIGVSGRDLGKGLQQALKDDLRGFEAAARRMEQAVDRLARVMGRGSSAAPAAGGGPDKRLARIGQVLQARAGRVSSLRQRQAGARSSGTPAGEREAERLEVQISKEKQKALKTAQLQQRIRERSRRNLGRLAEAEERLAKATEKAASARERGASRTARGARPATATPAALRGGPREQVALKQTGPSNQQVGANIDATRRAGSERTAGSTGSASIVADSPRVRDNRVGTRQDRPQFRKEAQERERARAGGGAEYIKGAQASAERVASNVAKLEAAIRNIPQFQGMNVKELLGLPSKVGVGKGAAPTVTMPSGEERVVKQAASIFTDEMGRAGVHVGDVITQRIEKLLTGGALGKVEKQSRFRPDRAEAMLREEIRQVFEGPKLDPSKVMGGFAAAGQAQVKFKPTEEQRKRIAAKPPGAEQIAETVAILHEMSQKSDAFRKAGLEVVSVIGMAEEKAADLADALRSFTSGDTDAIEGLFQTRNLAGMGVGGAGTMRQARSFLMTQTQEMVGGETPKIKGLGEEAAYAGDIFGKKAVKHLKTAVVSSDLMPELKEDQFVLDKAAAKSMGMLEKKSRIVKDVGEDIVPGMMLQQGQVLGKDAKGKGVEFELKGAQAEVKEIERVIVNGVEAWKIHFEELNEMVTGGKMTTRAGGKGIVRVEENMAEKYGLPKGTQVAMGAEGMAKRGDIRTMIEMHASNIGKEIGKGGQEVADMIVDRMKNLGEALDVAIKAVSSELGIEGYTGAEVMTEGRLAKGAGGRAAVTTGEVAWMRLAKEGQRGPASMNQRFLDKPAQQSMEQRAEMIAQAKAMQANMAKVIEENYEFVQTLRAIAGASDEVTAGLKEVRPEEFKGMMPGLQDPAALEGTVLDPKLGEAMKLMLPKRGGGEEAIRLPAQGRGLGRRDAFETEMGQVGASDVTKLFDKIIQQAKQVRVATGQIDIAHDAEAYAEAAQITSRAIKDQIQQIYKLGTKTDAGKAAMKKFVDSFMPLIQQLKGPANIQFAKVKKTGERQVETYKGTAEEYVQSRKSMEQKMFAVQDIMAERSAKRTPTRPGSAYARQGIEATENIGRMGAIFDPENSELLRKSMEKLGVTLQEDASHVDRLYSRLEELKEQLVSTLAVSGIGRAEGRPASEALRPYAQAMGGGTAEAPMGVATEFRTDITAPLDKARERLEQLRQAGKNVDNALAAVERISALNVEVEGLPRDAVMLSKTDYENLKRSIMKSQGIGEGDALKRMQKGVSLRYPVTGGQSMQAVKILKDTMGKLPEGKVGVAGPPAGDPQDIESVIGALSEYRASLTKTIEDNKGFGAAADEARAEMKTLDPVIEGLRQSFISATQNLDFDGDKIAVFGALTEEASQSLRTFTEVAMRGEVSFENLLSSILTASRGIPGGGMGGVEEYASAFGKLAKGRTGDLRRAVMMPETPETSKFEARAHTAAKTSVGLLTDAFNKLQMSILGGAEQTGDAMATAVERIMLFINKSLAQKHGGGGAAGPMEFTEAFARGPEGLKEIFAGMNEMGDDIYGELGKFNKEYRERMYNMLIAQPRETVQQLAKEAGALESEGELTAENFLPTIKSMVDKLDLKGQFSTMWEMLENNMKKALMAEGMSAEEVSATMNKMLKQVDKRTGKPRGLDLNRLMKNMFPEYRATRAAGAKEIKSMPAMEQARQVLDMLGVQIGEAAEDAVGEFEIDTDPKEMAGLLASKVNSFLETMSDQFEAVSQEELARGGGLPSRVTGSIRGRYRRGADGGAGQIQVSDEKLFTPLFKSLATMERVARGEIPPTVEAFQGLSTALSNLASTLAHEGIHKAAKQFPDVIQSLVRRVSSAGGDLHKHAGTIYDALSQLANVKVLRGKFERIVKAQRAGATEFEGQPIESARRKAAQAFTRISIEEMVAHLANPEKWERLFGDLPPAVQEAARDAFRELATSAPEIVKPVQTWAEEVRSTVAEVMQSTFRGEGVGAARQAAADRTSALARGEGFPGREQYMRMREILGAGEKTLAYGRRMHGLAPFEKAGGKVKAGRVDIPAEDLVGQIGPKLRNLIETAAKGIADPGQAAELERQFKEGARQYYEALKSLGSDQFSGSAWKEYRKVQLEFQAAEATALINKAREYERQISEMQAAGQTETPEFRDIIERFDQTVQELFRSYEKNIKLGGAGRGTATGLAVTPDQLISDPALEMGLKPTGAQYQQVMQAYQGKEGTADFKKFAGLVAPMEQLLETIDAGEDATKQWTSVWDALLEKPEAFYENMVRVKEILAKWSRLKGLETDPFSEASLELKRMSDEANNAKKQMDKLGEAPRTQEAIDSLRAMNKEFNKIYQRGRTGSLAESLKEQMENARTEARRLQRELTEALQQGVELPRHFEPRRMQLVDPKSGQVLQTMEMQIKRFGKTAQVSLKQAGKASQAFGGHMQNALRRVVQWGFATGVVYGTIRAFRNLVDTVTTVEQKITALKKVMDTSITDFEYMQDAAVGFAKEFGVSIDEVLDGMVVYGQQGLKMNEIMDRTRATMLAVNTTTLSSTDATEALTAAHKVFGDAISQSTEFVDAWANVAAKHAITAEDLANAVKRSGAAAQVAGTSFEDFLGIVTAIGAVTRQSGKEIATSTKFMFRAMRRPKAQKELGAMGITSLTAGGDYREAMDILKELAGRWDSLTRAQQVNTAQAMAGIRHYNSFIVLMENFDEALLASADAANSQGFAMRKNRLAMQTMNKQMHVLRESVKGVALEVGKAFLPVATSMVNVLGKIIGLVGELPGPLLQAGTLIAGLGITIHKGLDLALDSLEAIAGQDLAEGAREAGVFGMARDAAGGARRAGAGMIAGASAALAGKGMEEGVGRLATTANRATKAMVSLGGAVSSWAYNVGSALPLIGKYVQGMKAATSATKALMATTVVGAVVAAAAYGLYELYTAYQEASKSAKEFEQEMENVIGRSEDAASSLRSQSTHADRVTLAYKKFQKALSAFDDPEGLQAALDEGRYKSASAAAREYSDTVADISNNLAKVSPEKVTGLTEAGDYIVGISDAFKQMTESALDAQNAVTAALKTDVIRKYAEELREIPGIWDDIKEAFTGEEQDPLARLEEADRRIRELAAKRKEAGRGGRYTGAGGMREAVKEREAAREAALAPAKEIKRIFESMPVFEDFTAGLEAFTPDLEKALSTATKTGVFGRGVTGESLAVSHMARQAGLGGILGTRETLSPAMAAGAMYERGIGARAGAGAVAGGRAGEMAVVGADVARQLLENSIAKGFEGADVDTAVSRAQVLFTEIDQATGELFYRYRDSITGEFERVSSESLQAMVEGVESREGQVAAQFARFGRKEIEAAAEQTKKILSLQYTGALAGIRVPRGGMPDIGPAREEDLSAEQRMMKDIPIPLQRLADVQAELNQITEQYSEDVLSDVEGAYTRQEKSGKALKVLTRDVLQLTTQLQREGFNLTVLAHYSKAQAELNMILEKSAETARDAAAAERIRSEYLVETSGAMAGKSPIDISFGKTLKELSSVERAQVEVPGFEETARQIKALTMRRQQGVEVRVEIDKAMRNFEDAVSDLSRKKEELTAEQFSKYLETRKAGASTGEMALLQALEEGDKAVQNVLGDQLSVQQNMLSALGGLQEIAQAQADYTQEIAEIEASDASPQEKAVLKAQAAEKQAQTIGKATTRRLAEADFTQMRQALSEAVGAAGMDEIYRQLLSIREEGGEFTAFKAVEGLDATMQESIASLMTALRSEPEAVPIMGPGGLAGPVPVGTEYRATAQLPGGERATFTGTSAEDVQEQIRSQLDALMKEVMTAGPVGQKLRERAQALVRSPETRSNAAQAALQRSLEESATIEQQIAQRRKELFANYAQAMGENHQELTAVNDILMRANEKMRLSAAANDLASSLEMMVDDFRKAEMLTYNKIDSDLEGPFARVGQPGFKTTFEQRREELREGQMRPTTLAEMRQRRKDLAKVEFDEEEAKIKQKQDIEVKALRQQQQQAESVMGKLADTLYSGMFEGTDMESQIKRYIETLKSDLATSEQAEMRGDELFFKGVPALEEVQRFAQQMRQQAAEKQKEAQSELYRASITDPLQSTLKEEGQRQLQALKSIEGAIKAQTDMTKGAQKALDPTGSVSLDPAVQASERINDILKAGAGTKSMIQAVSQPGARYFEGGKQDIIPEDVKRGRGTIDLNEFFKPAPKEKPQVGLTNRNIQTQVEARATTGRPDASPGTLIATEEGISGAASDPARRVNERGDADSAATSEAAVSIADSIESLVSALEAFSSEGIRLPDDFVSSLSDLGTQVGEAVAGQTLSVEIADTPLSVTIDNISDLASASAEAATSSLGADLTELGTRLSEVEGLASVGGTLETRISELEEGLSVESVTRETVDTDHEERLVSVEAITEQLNPDAFETLTTQTADLNTQIIDLDERVTENEGNITDLQTSITDFQTIADSAQETIDSFGTRLEEVETISSESAVAVEGFAETLATFETAFNEVSSLAEEAQSIAEETRDSLTEFRAEVESQKQNLEAQIRELTSTVDTNETDRQSDKRKLADVEGIAKNAQTIAQNALSIAQAAPRR